MVYDISSDFTINTNISSKSEYQIEWFKYAVDFDGSVDWLEIPDSNTLSVSDNENGDGTAVDGGVITVSAWIYRRANAYNAIIGKWSAAGNNREWQFYIDNANRLTFDLADRDGAEVEGLKSDSNLLLPINTWNHVAATYDGRGGSSARNGINLYINGNAAATANSAQKTGTYVSSSNSTGSAWIGYWQVGSNTNSGYSLDGQIAQVCLWTRALNSEQVKTLYNVKNPENNQLPAPAAYWRMGADTSNDSIDGTGDNTSANTINDQIGTMHAVASDNMTSADISNSLMTELIEKDPTIEDLNRDAPFRFMVPGPINIRQRNEAYKVTVTKK